ncbi:MAG: malectin domain-containing carbohydrate-binding protein [Bryobacteraceae bacterium]
MPTAPPSTEQQRDCIRRLLASEGIARAANISKLLTFLSERYFSGAADDLKEYTIATECFGRPANFDPRRDSIVRVEAFRLRRAIDRYYSNGGASDPVRAVIPTGRYYLEFIDQAAYAPAEAEPEPEPAPAPPPSIPNRKQWGLVAALLAVVLTAAAFLYLRRPQPKPAAPTAVLPAATQPRGPINIRIGSSAEWTSSLGQLWQADRYFTGGQAVLEPPRPIRNTQDQALYLTRREGDFQYDIPLDPGAYELRLHFAETLYGPDNPARGGEASRIFRILANGQVLIAGLDVLTDAGGSNTADILVFKDIHPAPDGLLHLAFASNRREKAMLSGIEILPGTPGRMLPVRISMAPYSFKDRAGQQWLSDRYFSGGLPVHVPALEVNDPEAEFYRHHRYGHFTYTIPVARNSTYTVRLRFVEHHFGPGRPGGDGPGRRIYDVYCNGVALLRDFDILTQAAPLEPVQRTFRGIKPNAQGKLILQFVPVRNYALLSGLEVIDEAQP